jgi:hypothetical protein
MHPRTNPACRNLLILLVLILASCVSSRPIVNRNAITVTGTIRHFELEGGFFAIQGDDGVTYDPVNLPPRFRVDGLRVRVVAIVRRDLAGIHMVGPIIEIQSIVRE